jgi:hypothetical protein
MNIIISLLAHDHADRYAYAITVRLPGGREQACLVPFVGLMNHHGGAPHIVHYSKVHEESQTLRQVVMEDRRCICGVS